MFRGVERGRDAAFGGGEGDRAVVGGVGHGVVVVGVFGLGQLVGRVGDAFCLLGDDVHGSGGLADLAEAGEVEFDFRHGVVSYPLVSASSTVRFHRVGVMPPV